MHSSACINIVIHDFRDADKDRIYDHPLRDNTALSDLFHCRDNRARHIVSVGYKSGLSRYSIVGHYGLRSLT